jgi:hypothetical protein
MFVPTGKIGTYGNASSPRTEIQSLLSDQRCLFFADPSFVGVLWYHTQLGRGLCKVGFVGCGAEDGRGVGISVGGPLLRMQVGLGSTRSGTVRTTYGDADWLALRSVPRDVGKR